MAPREEQEGTMRELTSEEVRDLVCDDEPEADDLLDWAVAHEIEGERRRWSTRVTTILRTPEGEHFAVEWDRANLDSSDHEFWPQVPTPVQRSAVTSYKGTTKTGVTYEWTPLAPASGTVRKALREQAGRVAEARAKLTQRAPYSNIPCGVDGSRCRHAGRHVWLRKRDDGGALMLAAGWEVV